MPRTRLVPARANRLRTTEVRRQSNLIVFLLYSFAGTRSAAWPAAASLA